MLVLCLMLRLGGVYLTLARTKAFLLASGWLYSVDVYLGG